MNKLKLFLLSILAFGMHNCSQPETTPQERNVEQSQTSTTFKLYPTSNVWTFLKLDTRNGKIWQVQFSVDDDNYRFEVPLNLTPLISNEKEVSRFELYPTQNIYNFILLDGVDGRTWQVQWSDKLENRGIIPIQQHVNTF